jgi:DNA repair ATPase RecN
LEDYERSFRDILVQLGVVCSRSDKTGHKNISEADVTFIQELQQAHTDLKTAITSSDPEPLKKCIWRLKRILTKIPVVIDTRLNAAARALRLSELIGALVEIQKDLKDLKIDPEKVGKFNDGFAMLQSMDQRLNILLTEHEKWQSVDIEMRRIDAMIEQDLTELEMSWDDLKAQSSPLYTGLTETWAVSIQGYATQLDDYLLANNPAKIRQAFRNFRHESASHFFQVDLNLKALCSELRQIGEPLTAIVRSIG